MSNEANELLMSGGVRAFQFNQLGDTCRGQIVSDPKVENCYKMRWDANAKRWERTDELDKWPSGEVKRQIVLTIQTDHRVDPDDDGRRTLYIHSRIQPALRDAVRASGAKGLAVGGTVAVRWSSGAGTQDGGPKVYDCAYQPPAPPTVDPGSLLPGANQATPAAPATTTTAAPATNPVAQSLGLTAPVTPPPAPQGVDPTVWANLPDTQRQAVLAAMDSPAATAAPF